MLHFTREFLLWFLQVLVNLVNNGIKFTESGTVVVTVDVKQETEEFCEFMFHVFDTGKSLVLSHFFIMLINFIGIGIAQEDVGKLFKRFSQLNSQRYGGSGLGLAISAEVCSYTINRLVLTYPIQLVRLMGGEIGVFSAGRGKGCTLWFSCRYELPTTIVPEPEAKKPKNLFDSMVAYKEDKVGLNLCHFISSSYSIY